MVPFIGELCLAYHFSISTLSTKALKSKIMKSHSPLEQTELIVMPSKLRGTQASARGWTRAGTNWSSRNCGKETRFQGEQGLVILTANV